MDYKHYDGSKKKYRMEDEVDCDCDCECECEHGHGNGRQVDGSGVEVAGATINSTVAIIVEQEDDAEDLDDFFASLE